VSIRFYGILKWKNLGIPRNGSDVHFEIVGPIVGAVCRVHFIFGWGIVLLLNLKELKGVKQLKMVS
jgi:hypothetical protein